MKTDLKTRYLTSLEAEITKLRVETNKSKVSSSPLVLENPFERFFLMGNLKPETIVEHLQLLGTNDFSAMGVAIAGIREVISPVNELVALNKALSKSVHQLTLESAPLHENSRQNTTLATNFANQARLYTAIFNVFSAMPLALKETKVKNPKLDVVSAIGNSTKSKELYSELVKVAIPKYGKLEFISPELLVTELMTKVSYEKLILVSDHLEELKKEVTTTLYEGWTDIFKGESSSLEKFNTELEQVKTLANRFGLKLLAAAVAKAESQFEQNITGQDKRDDPHKFTQITLTISFSHTVIKFISSLRSFIAKLPSMKKALEAAKTTTDPTALVSSILTPDEQTGLKGLIKKEWKSYSAGWGKWIKDLVGGGVNNQDAMKYFGYEAENMATDLLSLTPKQLSDLVNDSVQIKPIALPAAAPAAPGQPAAVTPEEEKQVTQVKGALGDATKQNNLTGVVSALSKLAQDGDLMKALQAKGLTLTYKPAGTP